ncbi:hypothetical protein D920_02002 [Enterococcus faecalis 13-SD-W-01]|nr:hypothetical protein D920_02002 [Enterococcus faecalis 13-SD-W-01]
MKKTFLIKMVCIVFIAACAFPITAQAKNSTGELVISGEVRPEDKEDGNQSTGTGSPDREPPGASSRPKDSASSKRLPQLNENNRYANVLQLLGVNFLLLFLILISLKKEEAMP